MKELLVTALHRYELPQDRLRGAAIELPLAKRAGAYRLAVEGWVAGSRSEPTDVELLGRDGRPVLRMAVERSRLPAEDAAGEGRFEFRGSLGALSLEPDFELRVRVLFEDGGHALVGAITGRRTRLSTSFEPRLQPLMLTSLGRTGSSWLAWLLGQHPGVAAFRPFAHDARVATYWMSVLRSLAQPRSYLAQVSATDFGPPLWWLGEGRLATSTVADDSVDSWLEGDAIEELAWVCQARVEAFYERAAPREEKPAGRYFVEKAQPEGLPSDLALELYPKSREIILVRDFRDVLASVLAFESRRGAPAFGRGGGQSDDEYLSVFRASAEVLLERWRRRADEAHLVRYEDLVRDPAATLAGAFRHLGLDAEARTVESVLEAGAVDVPGMRDHRTTPDAAISIGRWRSDLPPRLAREANAALGDVLSAFGYSAKR